MKMRITLLVTVQRIQLPVKSRYEEGSAPCVAAGRIAAFTRGKPGGKGDLFS